MAEASAPVKPLLERLQAALDEQRNSIILQQSTLYELEEQRYAD